VIRAAAILPHPPLLLRENAGRTPVAADLRAACAAAVRDLAARCDSIVVVSGHAAEPRGARRSLGARLAGELLGEAGRTAAAEVLVPFDAAEGECAAIGERAVAGVRSTAGLLVMADGSARRGPAAPGHLDDRARPFDAAFLTAVREGDVAALAGLDAGLAAELWFQGRAALGVLAAMAPGRPRVSVRYADDPFGVFYVVALLDFTAASAPAGRR
jgi:hypothetical protein